MSRKNGTTSREEQELHAQVEQVRGRLQGLTADLRAVEAEVERLAPQRAHHQLLEQACGSLEKLAELGADALFWGERVDPARVAQQLRGARGRLSAFQAQFGELDGRRQAILAGIGREEDNLEILGDDLYQIREAEERRKHEWVLEREISAAPAHVPVMPWTRGGEDDRRFRKSLTASLMVGAFLGVLPPMIDLPLPDRFQPDEMPQRIVQFVRQERARFEPPPVVPPAPAQAAPEAPKPPEPKVPKPAEPPQPTGPRDQPAPGAPDPAAAQRQAQARVGKAGILAFREAFVGLAHDRVAPRLGADARYGNADDASRSSSPSRSMLTTNAPGSSGGINLSSLSRNVGGGGGGAGGGGGSGGLHGVQVGRATSSIAGIGGGGGDRPLARGGPGLSRTDEEIQIVFDRYKASFYRMYNRELRNDPTLRGQMVLRLTIEPDGSVSMCQLQSTDMDAPDLAAQVVERVRMINFGAKDGVQALTIVYPIDFLPAGEADS